MAEREAPKIINQVECNPGHMAPEEERMWPGKNPEAVITKLDGGEKLQIVNIHDEVIKITICNFTVWHPPSEEFGSWADLDENALVENATRLNPGEFRVYSKLPTSDEDIEKFNCRTLGFMYEKVDPKDEMKRFAPMLATYLYPKTKAKSKSHKMTDMKTLVEKSNISSILKESLADILKMPRETRPSADGLVKALAASLLAKANRLSPSAAGNSSSKNFSGNAPAAAKFFDMVHSNNAARIRLWLRLKNVGNSITTKMVTYPDLQTPEFIAINPMRKVPALITSDGTTIFESYVIMQYLEDKYGHIGQNLVQDTPKKRAFVQLLVRIHDIYIASPNCTQPGFAHTQGCMYLAPHETKFCSAARAMSTGRRAKKLAEIWKHLTWLEGRVIGPYLAGEQLTHADLTWYPTCIFMEFMLPRVFGWPKIFHESDVFPRLRKWFDRLAALKEFAQVHEEIWGFWVEKEKAGQFISIQEVVATSKEYKWVYP